MRSSYIESYKDLYHGTTEEYAAQIVDTQTFIPSETGWCGKGVYFYDNKAKAWWSAQRTCYQERKRGKKAKADVVIADIPQLSRSVILDLRTKEDMIVFADYVEMFFSEVTDFYIVEKMSEKDCLEKKRAMLLNFFCKENNRQLIIGYFKQEHKEEIQPVEPFASAWQLAIGIETIYCAKIPKIVKNIRRR